MKVLMNRTDKCLIDTFTNNTCSHYCYHCYGRFLICIKAEVHQCSSLLQWCGPLVGRRSSQLWWQCIAPHGTTLHMAQLNTHNSLHLAQHTIHYTQHIAQFVSCGTLNSDHIALHHMAQVFKTENYFFKTENIKRQRKI